MRFSSLAASYFLLIVPGLNIAFDALTVAAPDSTKVVGILLKDGLLLLLVVWAIVTWRTNTPGVFAALFTVVAYCILSSLWNEKRQSWEVIAAAVRNYGLYPLVFMLTYRLGQVGAGQSQLVIKIFIYGIVLNLILGLLQASGFIGSPYLKMIGKDDGSFVWVHGAFVSYIEYAFYLSYCIVLLILVHDGVKRHSAGSTLLPLVALSGLLVILSQSRTGIAAWALAALAFTAITTSPRRAIVLLALAVPTTIALLFQFLPTHRLLTGEAAEDFRFVSILPFAVDAFAAAPFFGSGLGSYGAASVLGDYEGEGIEYLDSTILSVALQFGIFGFLAYFGFIVSQFVWIDTRARRYGNRGLRMANLVVAALTLLYSAIFNFADGWPGAIYAFGWLGYMRARFALNLKTSEGSLQQFRNVPHTPIATAPPQ